jgi:hypothetical protein
MIRVLLARALTALCVSPTESSEVLAVNNSSAFSAATQQDLAAIQAAAESSDYFYEQVRFMCNSIGPRLSGSPQAAAVEYVGKKCALPQDFRA